MKFHTKLYFIYFGYDTSDYIGCEICGAGAVDIHHIESRGMGGTKKLDCIENLMALCRKCHLEYGDKKQHLDYIKRIHANKIDITDTIKRK